MAPWCFVHVDNAILAGELHKLQYAEWCHWGLAQDGMAPGSSKTAVEMNRAKEKESHTTDYIAEYICMDYLPTSSQIVARHLLDSYVCTTALEQATPGMLRILPVVYLLHTG